MVGLVLVSHSRPLATAVQELVRAMTQGNNLKVAVAAGAGDNHVDLGTDAVEISEGITAVMGEEGVLVLMDMGSAILSAETALEFLEEPVRKKVRLCAAPFVEGAVAASVTANLGEPLERVYAEALAALKQKQSEITHEPDAPASATATPAVGTQSPAQSVRVVVRNPHGLHARPAARLIGEARPFKAEIKVRNLTNSRGPVSLRSLSSLASLEILQGHEIEISATGNDAAAALEKLSSAVKEGLGESLQPPAPAPTAAAFPKKAAPAPSTAGKPVPISDGLAIGKSYFFQPTALVIPQTRSENPAAESERLQVAKATVLKALQEKIGQTHASLGKEQAGIYEAQVLALEDPELIQIAQRAIESQRANAAQAWDEASRQILLQYQSLADPYLRERAVDLQDVTRQVLAALVEHREALPALDSPGILVAHDLTPGQVSTLPRDRVLGVLLLEGGPTAHSSILLRALGIPALVQARSALGGTPPEKLGLFAFDGGTGQVWLQPDQALLDELTRKRDEAAARAREEKKLSSQPGATADGTRIEIFANVGKAGASGTLLESGAEGIGLLRTEFLFIEKEAPPTEEEQVEALSQVAQSAGGKPVIVRTLDAGGDKKLAYLALPAEANPFLGVRALRLCFAQPELFQVQLRAILRAARGHDFRIMFPMIADLSDLARARAALEAAHQSLVQEKKEHAWPLPVGIMIEIPSAAVQAGSLAAQADFFSIGTNDLTQYTLAADRGNPSLGAYQDALHPAVLRLIQATAKGAATHQRLVAVCGEAGADPVAAAIFIGLGVRELSLSSARIPRLKTVLRGWKLPEMEALALRALECTSATQVRELAASLLRP